MAFLFLFAWLAFPVLTVDFRDGWWYACFGRAMVERHSLHVPVTEWVLRGTWFHRPAWLYGLWAFGLLSLSPVAWLLGEVVLFGGVFGWVFWRLGDELGLSPVRRGFALLLAGWLVFPEQWLRPQIALVPTVAGLWLWIARDLRGTRPSPAWIVLLSALAGNLHGGVFLLGGMLGVWAVMRRDLSRTAQGFLAWGLGSSLHPYFPEPWRTNLEFGLHPPGVAEWEPLLARGFRESPGVMALWLVPVLILILVAWRLWNHREARFFLITTAFMFVFAWFKASRFVTWALLGESLLVSMAWPSRWRISSPLMTGILFPLALLGVLRVPWVEDRVRIQDLAQIPPPSGLTWGMGRVAHILCWIWPETPLLNTGLDAIHPDLATARRAGVRFVVTHDQENPGAGDVLAEMGAKEVRRSGAYALWAMP